MHPSSIAYAAAGNNASVTHWAIFVLATLLLEDIGLFFSSNAAATDCTEFNHLDLQRHRTPKNWLFLLSLPSAVEYSKTLLSMTEVYYKHYLGNEALETETP